MDRIKLVLCIAFLALSQAASAATVSYKYKIDLFFGIKANCTVNNQAEISQVRFSIDKADLTSRKTFIASEVRISACVITGSLIKEHFDLPMPKFLFSNEAAIQGTFPIEGNRFFSKISINEKSQGTYQLKYFDKAGKPWKVIDDIEITKGKKAHPDKIKFDVTSRNQTIEARLRLIEEK